VPEQLRVLAIGAHPDDCDYSVGGLALKYVEAGAAVKLVSVSNGNAGHFAIGGGPLAKRRREEARCSATIAGVEYELLDISDTEIIPTLENRWRIVRLIREFRPDLVLTNRPNDYHPDHRYTSQLVADAAYTVTIPNVQALTPHLRYNPVIAYWPDNFKRPYPFSPDIAVSIDDVVAKKMDMLFCHESQFFEWIPYNANELEAVPEGAEARRAWLAERRLTRAAHNADHFRALLARFYGEEKASTIQYAEALELCEYGGQVTEKGFPRLFPFYE